MSEARGAGIATLRGRLAGRTGRQYWRGLEELAGTPEFQDLLRHEFAAGADTLADPVQRRTFVSLMAASLALAGLTGCTRQPRETIAPYAEMPEQLVPGKPLYYASALTLAGFARGVLVETHEGRPTKIEGNPDHPASRGATDVFMQAAPLELYDPDRSRTVTFLGNIAPWSQLLSAVVTAIKAQAAKQGAGLRILTETITSPTVAAQLAAVLAQLPRARWTSWEPINRDNARAGAAMSFGHPVTPQYQIAKADVILSLEADFVAPGGASLAHIREFAGRRRRGGEAGGGMNRLYMVESTPSAAGAVADHRLPLASSEVEHFARAVAAATGLPVAQEPGAASRLATHTRWIDAVARDLQAHRGACLVLAGDHQPPAVHALAHALNSHLGAIGRTVTFTDPVEAGDPDQASGLSQLAADLRAGAVDLLLILGGNPAYSAPVDLDFAGALGSAGLSIHLGSHDDETSARCHWHVPMAHELEAWGDARAWDGTITIQQPMIAPLYDGRTTIELLGALTGNAGRPAYDLLREHWRGRLEQGMDFERWWRRTLHDGLVAGSALPAKNVTLRTDWMSRPGQAPAAEGLEIVFRPDPSAYDGRFVNNGWLQELPRPITRLTWDNAALLAPALAWKLGLENSDVIELSVGGRTIEAPVWIVPGQAFNTVALHLGYGRNRTGRVGQGAGFDAGALRASSALWLAHGATLKPTDGTHALSCTQLHGSMEGRGLVRWASLDEFHAHPDFVKHAAHEPAREESLFPPYKYEGHAWGMVIDLNSCVGCNACVIGCQAENNIPIVGRSEVANGREMHWIRMDRYFEGDENDPAIWNQPVPCMQCENAPCETVCPVGATVHSSEGLNDMVYNRCVGTRYCANNCPYKVRRFNFLLYQDFKEPSLKLLHNPDVTVRSRGVMEKCTYCVQRINQARIETQKQDRPIRDGEILTACQQACPAQAITFGDLNDPASRVSTLRADPRNYGLLTELGTRPRTTYLAALRNPNPELEKA